MIRNSTFTNGQGTLYLIATPIGNLLDISTRMKETLEMVSYLLCEDTRNTIKIMDYLGIHKKLVSYHKFNEKEMTKQILNDLEKGLNIGLVSDAGFPCISDPGYIISKEAILNGFNVTSIGGPCAFLQALVCSGLDTDHFYFYGFLSSKETQKKVEIESLKNIKDTMIFYETSNRMSETLLSMKEILGNRNFCIAREISKKYEEFIYGNLGEDLDLSLKGECVLVIEGKKEELMELDSNVKEVIEFLLEKEITAKDISKIISKVTNISKNEIYDYIVKKTKK